MKTSKYQSTAQNQNVPKLMKIAALCNLSDINNPHAKGKFSAPVKPAQWEKHLIAIIQCPRSLTVTQNAREVTQNVDDQKELMYWKQRIETWLNEGTMWHPVSEWRKRYVRKAKETWPSLRKAQGLGKTKFLLPAGDCTERERDGGWFESGKRNTFL